MTKNNQLLKKCYSAFIFVSLLSCGGEGHSSPRSKEHRISPITTGTVISNKPLTSENAQAFIAQDSPQTRNDARRFLLRTTFGPKQQEVNALMATTYEDWLERQFNISPSYQTRRVQNHINRNNDTNPFTRSIRRSDIWFDTVVNGQDQLRQRVAFALSQIFVVSEKEGVLNGYARSMANYNDVLIRNAFGNFRTLMEEATLHPAMGNFLSMRANSKGNDDGTIQPDENYAREIMQLFTIGLNELWRNGTNKVDSQGKPIPTYGMKEVLAFARVFTGWNYDGLRRFDRSNYQRPDSENLLKPMIPYEDFHDRGEKRLLNGVVLPANQNARRDLTMALDNLFNHPNVAPFISKQLIQRLVTSNPSRDYVRRISIVFNDNGSGVRGDLKATVKAILLDSEALMGHQTNPRNFGKLKEPVLKLTHLWRAFDARGAGNQLRYVIGDRELGQKALAAPSVFNFFSPSFSQPGAIEDQGKLSPEFQIFTETTAITIANRLRSYIFNDSNGGSNPDRGLNRIILNFDTEKRLANRPQRLVDHLNDYLFAGEMTDSTKATLTNYITQTPMNDDGTLRVREGLTLALLSPDFAYQR